MNIIDPAMYYECSKPYPDEATANERLQAFFDDLYAIRCKHHIADVHCVVRVTVVGDAKTGGVAVTHIHIGDELLAESMLAVALGETQSRRQQLIRDALTHDVMKQPRSR